MALGRVVRLGLIILGLGISVGSICGLIFWGCSRPSSCEPTSGIFGTGSRILACPASQKIRIVQHYGAVDQYLGMCLCPGDEDPFVLMPDHRDAGTNTFILDAATTKGD